MKVHKYQITVYESVMDWAHSMGKTQTRLYIPNQRVFAFRSRENIDFFADDPKIIADAEKCISEESNIKGGVKYLDKLNYPTK